MSEQESKMIKVNGVKVTVDNFHMVDNRPLAPDVLRGVPRIAGYLHEECDKSAIRTTYHWLASSRSIPAYKWGSMWCARKSSIRATIWSQERRAWTGDKQEDLVRVHILLNNILAALSESNDNSQILPLMAEAARTIQRVLKIGS